MSKQKPNLKLLLFSLYIILLLCQIFSALFGIKGFLLGLCLSVLFFVMTFMRSTQKLTGLLHLKRLTFAEKPDFFEALEFFCRKLNYKIPTVWIYNDPTLNMGCFGLCKKNIILTQGIFKLPLKEQVSIGLYALKLSQNPVCKNHTILSLYLLWFERRTSEGFHSKPLKILRSFLLIIGIFVPYQLLKTTWNIEEFKMHSLFKNLSWPMEEAKKHIKISMNKSTFSIPFSATHLFLWHSQKSSVIELFILQKAV